jgi:hypothetical protein
MVISSIIPVPAVLLPTSLLVFIEVVIVPLVVIGPPDIRPVVPTEVTVPADDVAYSTAVSPALTRKTFNELPVKESIGASLLSSDIVPVVVIGPPVKPVPVATFVTVPPAGNVVYSNAVPPELTLNTWNGVPKVDKPVPPLSKARVPVHPNVIETLFRRAVDGIPARVIVTFVSSVLVNGDGMIN